MRLQALAVDEGNALIERYGGEWRDSLGLGASLSTEQIQKSIGDFVGQGAQWLLERRALARLRRRRDRQFLLVPDRHAGRRLLHPGRLEQDDRDARRLAAARPPRRLARDRLRDRRRAGRVHSRPVARLPVRRPLVRDRADADRPRLRLPHRRDRRRPELHSLCGIADRADPVARRRPRPGLAEPEAVLPRPRRRRRRGVSRSATSLRPSWWAAPSACIRSG